MGEQVQQLNQILARLGYGPWPQSRIQQDFAQIHQRYTDLHPAEGEFFGNDGRSQRLLKLGGTVPVSVQGSSYNFPFTVWLPKNYPDTAPMCFVNPTESMIIRSGHSVVSLDGVCTHPALQQWQRNQSLAQLLVALCSAFSHDPPLFARPAGQPYTVPPPVNPSWPPAAAGPHSQPPHGTSWPPHQPASQPPQNPYAGSRPPGPPGGGVSNPYHNAATTPPPGAAPGVLRPPPTNPYTAQTAAPSPYGAGVGGGGGGSPPPPVAGLGARQQSDGDWEADLKRALRDQLLPRLREQCASQLAIRKVEIHGLEEKRRGLLAESHRLDKQGHEREVAKLIAAHEAGANTIQISSIEAWLREHEQRAEGDAASIARPASEVQQQIRELKAEDEVCDDVAYVYERRVKDGEINCRDYAKMLRSLYERQFMARALLNKCSALERPG